MKLVGSPPPPSLAVRGRLAALEARFREIEPEVVAFVPEPNRFERLRREEERQRVASGKVRGPGRGLLVGVKDVFHVDGLPTLAGTSLSPGRFTGTEASVVDRLRRSGALVVGKTVATELAYFAPGPTRNPHAPDHTPGGSSSGSAAGVAAGLCDVALGTQTIGSVNRPASFCGVWGFKPTRSRVPADGMVHLAPSLDQVGWFARGRLGLAKVAELVIDDWDADSLEEGDGSPRLALPIGPYLERAEEAMLVRMREVADRWVDEGGEVVEVEVFEDFEEIEARHRRILAREFRGLHRPLLEEVGGRLDERTHGLSEEGREVSASRLEEDLAAASALAESIDRRMEEEGIDAWLCPSAVGPAPEGLDSTGDPVMNLPWTQVGLPTLSVPAGSTAGGLPLGMQWIGRRGGDEELLGLLRGRGRAKDLGASVPEGVAAADRDAAG